MPSLIGALRVTAIAAAIAFNASCAATGVSPTLEGAASCPAVASAGAEVEAIRQLEHRGARVNVEGWTEAEARDFNAPEFFSVQPDGSVLGLEAALGSFTEGRSRAWARSFELVELDIQVFNCSTAAVVGLAEARPLGAPDSNPPLRLRFLNVWRKQDGRWLYAGNQYVVH